MIGGARDCDLRRTFLDVVLKANLDSGKCWQAVKIVTAIQGNLVYSRYEPIEESEWMRLEREPKIIESPSPTDWIAVFRSDRESAELLIPEINKQLESVVVAIVDVRVERGDEKRCYIIVWADMTYYGDGGEEFDDVCAELRTACVRAYRAVANSRRDCFLCSAEFFFALDCERAKKLIGADSYELN